MTRALSDSTLIDIAYADETRFGAMISGRAEIEIKRRARAALATIDRLPAGPLPLEDLRHAAMSPTALGELASAPGRLREDWLHPDPACVRPEALLLEWARDGERKVARVPIEPTLTSELARWLGDWHREARPPRSPAALRLYAELDERGLFDDVAARAPLPRNEVTFVGHATVLLQTARTRLLVDPFFLPQPPQAGEYAPIAPSRLVADVVLVTHSHPDHFHPGLLLRLGADVPIVVPDVPRESVLAVDMAARLSELGFSSVRRLGWGDELACGDFHIRALPFFGEQPTSAAILHPEVRNLGNLYTVEGEGRRYAFIADAGRDAAGDCTDVARSDRAAHGPVDVLFGGYRVWGLYPVHLLRSSVSRYLPFVPESEWPVRQKLMNGPDELLDAAEAWGARVVVPYADGGAPWYWHRGLGPKLDDPSAGNASGDPRPEEVAVHAARRSTWLGRPVASPVVVAIMRPGESLALAGETVTRVRHPGHVWPYPAQAAGEPAPPPPGEAERLALARKKVLLRVLAVPALERLGLTIEDGAAQSLADTVRRLAGLTSAGEMRRWLDEVGLSRDAFAHLMFEWACSNRLEAHLRGEIDARLPGQLALEGMRFRRASAGAAP